MKNILFDIDPKNAVEAIDSLLSHCTRISASDIHCDPLESSFAIRVRVDGIIYDIGSYPLDIHHEFITRLKILSGTRTDLHFVPQDGRWRARIDGEFYNIRISFMPTYYGENAVMRILPAKTDKILTFKDLGFNNSHTNQIEYSLKQKNGLILVTGPTGSGKTTTLRSCLNYIAKDPLSIITLEDPVEYEIAKVRQIHIRQDLGVSFASALRSSLRQDPDVIMVGEIRDKETATIAIHTALTGHLVLSTLHTNSALETIPRLIDMGIDNYLLSSTLRLIISQRLVRKICTNCQSKMCDECNFTGYLGRVVVAEVLPVDRRLSEMIYNKTNFRDIYKYLKQNNFITIREDALEKSDWGLISQAEIITTLANEEK